MLVYRFKPPVLNATLAEGGSLAPNTTYFMFGFFQSYDGGGSAYQGPTSWRSEIISFTTTDTALTVNVAWKIVGDISSFENLGGGEVKVNCTEPHTFLADGNNVTINGIYAGTYSIKRIDYYTFSITAIFIGTEVNSWECSERLLGTINQSLRLWMHTSLDMNTAGFLHNDNDPYHNRHISHNYYGVGYTSTPITLTAEYPILRSPDSCQTCLEYLDDSYSYIQKTGIMSIVGTETTFVPLDVSNELKAAGLIPQCICNPQLFIFTGHIVFKQVTNQVSNMNIHTFAGHVYFTSATLYECNIVVTHPVVRQYLSYTSMFSISAMNHTNAVDGPPTPSFPTEVFKLVGNLNFSGGYPRYGPWFISPKGIGKFGMSYPYPNSSFNDAKLFNMYCYIVYHTSSGSTGSYFLKNIDLYNEGGNYDILVYSYLLDNIIQTHLNVNTPRPDNLKKCYGNKAGLTDIWMHFYRGGDLYINDVSGNPIDGAVITITSDTEIYNLISVNGVVSFEVLEQISAAFSGTISNNIIYNIKVEVKAAGYQDTVEYAWIGKNLQGMTIPMLEITPPIYINQEIKGSVSAIEVSGKVELPTEIVGIVSVEEIKGSIDHPQVDCTIEEINIKGEIL